ncbi:MAG TPA: tripartite tricarboxylate transporter permease [Beijerinckiaceae bacterium]|nr:tripartite tricarboxylate transporter permease [Beijerinckiaceae bacterium]
MEALSSLIHGFGVLADPMNIVYMFVGIFLGVLIGVLPGLGGANGVAILLPLTFSMSPVSAIIMLSSIYWGALFGGAITSILFNIPGEPWSVATTFDGYPMAQKGRAGEALATAFTGSFFGAFVATLLLTFLAPLIARFALQFGPAEFFSVYLLTFCSFVGMGKESPFKVIAAMMLGFALAAVGLDTVTGQLRMTFGSTELLRGFDFLVAVIGLFGVGEILLTMEEGLAFKGKSAKINMRVVIQTWKELPQYWLTAMRGAIVGCWMGITPGGATPASFMSYGLAKRFSRNGHKFGTGEVEGVLAPETAAHAAGTSALLPMLTLGIPGSPTAAVLLGGLLIWGLQPGPLLFVEQKDFVWGLIASMYLGNLAGLIVVLTTVPLFASILRIPFSIIAPVIVVICAIGAFTVHNAMLDVWLMLLFVEQKDFVWGLIASIYLGNIAGLIVVLTTVPLFAAILRVPFSIIAPIILVICAVGAYTVHNALLDISVMLVFGVIGYVFKKLGYPLAPLVLALVLGDMAESSFRQAMLVSQGNVGIFWSNPLVATIVTLALVMLFWPVLSALRDKVGGRRAADVTPGQ